jgi:outer membrane protein
MLGVSVGAVPCATPPRASTARGIVTTPAPARPIASSAPAPRGAPCPPKGAPRSFLNAPLARLLSIAVLLAHGAWVEAQALRVAIVSDGPTDRQVLSPDALARAVAEIGAVERPISLPVDKRFVGDWSLAGIDAALDRALRDPAVDVVVTLGTLASHEAAQRTAPPKPIIAPLVIDPMLQGFPLRDGTSGRHNFTYAADFQSVGADVVMFQRILGFTHLAVVVDDALLKALPSLNDKAAEVARALGVRITLVAAAGDAAAALEALPPDADAVFVTGLLRFDEDELGALARGLAARRLPSFSQLGRSEVERGLLMTLGGAERDTERLARRIALMIQRIAAGEDPATFDVSFPTEQRLAINMRVAGEIGFSPQWEFLTDAEQIEADAAAALPPLTLIEAMRLAVRGNPALAASNERLASSAEDVRIAKSGLLPSLELALGNARIDEDRANPLIQAEKTSTVGLNARATIYSERARASYEISRSLYEAARQGNRQDTLDTLEATASAYIDVLRARALEAVRRSNVENTRRNLETSRVREAVGLAERSDYLRWVAQLARDKQELLAAESARRQAEAELMRNLHRPADMPFATVETGLDDPLELAASPRMQAYIGTPARWERFMAYVVDAALAQAPEIAQTEAVIASNRRSVTAAKRSYFVPELALVSTGTHAASRRGAGSTALPGTPDDDSWSVQLQATLPLFAGKRRSAELAQARHDLAAAESERAAVADAIEARARVVLHRTAGSYPSIALSREAADAAGENLAMVADAYARGAVSVAELIDAQDASLEAGLAAADAKYGFLGDFIGVLRAMSEFDILLDPDSREAWYRRVDEWFRTHELQAPAAGGTP